MKILAMAREDLRLTLRDRSSIFWILLAPFLWVLFFGAAMRTPAPGSARISLGVIREDPSDTAGRFIESLKGENFEVTLAGQEDPQAEGRRPSRTLMIPAGFGDAIGRREKVTLDLRAGESANPEGTFAAQVALHKAAVRLLAGEAFGGFEPGGDAVTVRSSWATGAAGRGIPSGYYQTIPGNLVMFVLLSALTYGSALLAQERSSGVLRRLACSPLGRWKIVAGKLAGRAAVASLQVAVFLFMGLAVFRIDWGASPAGLVALLASFILCAAAIGLLGGALFTSADAASGVGVVLALIMAALGGCWWPAEVMPGWLRTVGHAFPSAWMMDGLHQVISWGGGLRDVLPHCGVLCLFGLAAGTLAARRLRLTPA